MQVVLSYAQPVSTNSLTLALLNTFSHHIFLNTSMQAYDTLYRLFSSLTYNLILEDGSGTSKAYNLHGEKLCFVQIVFI